MASPGTLSFVLRWYFIQFAFGLAMLAMGAVCLSIYSPDPPELPYQSLVGMLGPWPYVLGMVLGAINVLGAWTKGAKLCNGRTA